MGWVCLCIPALLLYTRGVDMAIKPIKKESNHEDIVNLRSANKLLENIPIAFDILNSKLDQILINQQSAEVAKSG